MPAGLHKSKLPIWCYKICNVISFQLQDEFLRPAYICMRGSLLGWAGDAADRESLIVQTSGAVFLVQCWIIDFIWN